MKKLIVIALAALVLTSCSSEFYSCPSYGITKKTVKYRNRDHCRFNKHGKRFI